MMPRLVVGLTGGTGSGKTTVAELLAAHGAHVVDCDALGRLVLEPSGRAYAGVVSRFGPTVVATDGRIDRPALAAIVFADPDALDDLNELTHPAIDDKIAAHIAATPPGAVVVLDMAVLVETRLGEGQYDVVVVVEAEHDARVARLVGRGLSEADARARIASQASDEQRRAVGHHFIRNDGDLDALEREVGGLWDELRWRHEH